MVIASLSLKCPQELLMGSSYGTGPTVTVIVISPESVTYTATLQLKNILMRYGVLSLIPSSSPLGGEGKKLDRLLCLGEGATDAIIIKAANRAKIEVEEIQRHRDLQAAEIFDLVVLDVVEALVEHQLASGGWVRLYDNGVFARGLLAPDEPFIDCCRVALTMDQAPHVFPPQHASAELSLKINAMIEPMVFRRVDVEWDKIGQLPPLPDDSFHPQEIDKWEERVAKTLPRLGKCFIKSVTSNPVGAQLPVVPVVPLNQRHGYDLGVPTSFEEIKRYWKDCYSMDLPDHSSGVNTARVLFPGGGAISFQYPTCCVIKDLAFCLSRSKDHTHMSQIYTSIIQALSSLPGIEQTRFPPLPTLSSSCQPTNAFMTGKQARQRQQEEEEDHHSDKGALVQPPPSTPGPQPVTTKSPPRHVIPPEPTPSLSPVTKKMAATAKPTNKKVKAQQPAGGSTSSKGSAKKAKTSSSSSRSNKKN